MSPDPNPERDRVFIENVPRLTWGKGQDCTFAGALSAAMAVTERPYSYAELMGLSGLAFRVRWSNDQTATGWCPSCAVGELPDEYEALERLTGWQLPTDIQFGETSPDTAAIRAKVIASIDAGKPIAAYASSYEMAVICGYEDGGETLLVHDYSRADDPFRLPCAQIGPMQTYLGAFKEPPSPRDALIESLRTAVQRFALRTHNGGIEGREYWYGSAALQAWMQDIGRFDELDVEDQGALYGLDRWVLAILRDARQAAVTFLRAHTPALDAHARKALERAAGAYQHEIEIMEPMIAGEQDIVEMADWTSTARQRELGGLAEVFQFESQAIAGLELALQSLTTKKRGETVILEGVDRYRVMEPMFEPVRVVLSSLGETYSPAYVQGISGAAFRIGGICPCAPTCACAMSTQDLLRVFGYQIETLSLCDEGMDATREAPHVITRVKDEIRAGRPAIVWHAFTTAEWDVVCGFDDRSHQFLGRGSYAGLDGYATADQGRTATCGAICPPMGAILVGDKTAKYDARRYEIAALKEAVAHAHSQENVEKLGEEGWVMLYGLACYDRWVQDLKADPPRLPTMGDRYCLGVNRSTHRAAAGFLIELAEKYPEAKVQLERAAERFVAEADALNECAERLFPAWQMPQEADQATNAKVATQLRTARDSYARGIDEIERALELIKATAD